MKLTTEITIAQFPEIQSEARPGVKYVGVGSDVLLSEHPYGKRVLNLMKALTDSVDEQNLLTVAYDENGYSSAVYGFNIQLNADNAAVVTFGNSSAEQKHNEVLIEMDFDEDEEPVFKAGNCEIVFRQNQNYLDAFISNGKLGVKAKLWKQKEVDNSQILNAQSLDEFASLLSAKSSGSGLGAKLLEICNPDLPETKRVTYPLSLEVTAFDNIFESDSFTSRNFFVQRTDGKPLFAKLSKTGDVVEIGRVTIYGNMAAGHLVPEEGVCKLALHKLYGGSVQILIKSGAKDPKYNPNHIVLFIPPNDSKKAIALSKANEELKSIISDCRESGKRFSISLVSDLLSDSSVRKFMESGAKTTESKKQLASVAASVETDDEDDSSIPF